jgi:hypothetical protein
MDHRQDDPLTDSSLDREIQSALAVDPSPEFLARVRTRVASELPGRAWRLIPSRWSFEPLVAVSVLGVVIAIVVGAWLRPAPGRDPAVVAARVEPQREVTSVPKPVQIGSPDVRGGVPASAEGSAERRRASGARTRQPLPVAADAPPFAEVLISRDEVLAYEQLLAAVQGRVPKEPAQAREDDTLAPLPLEISPVTIEPLPQIARLEIGERP